MKKIFTLAMGLLMTVMLFAADRRPSVIVNSSSKYEVVIDGRSFITNGRTISIDRLSQGRHSIRVFELRRNFRGMQKRLVAQSTFRLNARDVMIRISNNGMIQFKESRNIYRNDRDRDRDYNDEYGWNNGRNDRDDRYGRDDRNDRF